MSIDKSRGIYLIAGIIPYFQKKWDFCVDRQYPDIVDNFPKRI